MSSPQTINPNPQLINPNPQSDGCSATMGCAAAKHPSLRHKEIVKAYRLTVFDTDMNEESSGVYVAQSRDVVIEFAKSWLLRCGSPSTIIRVSEF